MKSFYVLIVVCLGLTLNGNSQYVTWIGPAGGTWNNAANWSPAAVPNSTSRITLPPNADITLDVSTSVHNIKVFSGWARISASGFQVLTLTGSDTALFVASGAVLRDSSLSMGFFEVDFAPASKGEVLGTWYFGGPNDGGSYVELPVSGAPACQVFGTMQFADNSLAPADGNTTLHFNAGSTLQLSTIQPIIPAADYDANSLIYISGVVINPVSNEEPNFVGNLTYACPNQADDLSLGMSGMTIGGNLFITNTNGNKLRIFWDGVSGTGPFTNTINGNLQITGTSKFSISEASATNIIYNLNVNGNLAMGGQEFDMQSAPNDSTNLFVKGNIQHTAGNFTVSSSTASSVRNRFNIELNGTGNQILSSVSNILDNAGFQVNLRINKPSGSVSLATPIAVGRLQFTTGNNANINTGANLLSVRKQTLSGDPVALQYSGTGFVEGTLQRSFGTTNSILFPLGTGTTYRPLKFNPSASTSSIYQATLTNGTHPTAIGVSAPLTGVAPYYWTLNKNAGADGNVELNLNGQVP
ncbi:MAG TPA: hypothetical protein VK628_02155, partial [Flavitalea sp.]|nr:hypothetical protein [Flavitalea sp.]